MPTCDTRGAVTPNIHVFPTQFPELMHHNSPAVLIPYVLRRFHQFPTVFTSSHHAQSGVLGGVGDQRWRNTATG
jgi:hypothetical protein